MTASAVEIQARTLSGYADASRLRQVHDRDWVLDQVPGDPEVLLDLGSGIGQLLRSALDRHPSLRLAVGLERSEHRIAEAAEHLRPYGDRVALHQADLTVPAPLEYRPDVVTMTSVLHWLYPDEDRILAWVGDHLAPGGHFLLTTYHPARDEHGLGGEDDLVRDALVALGAERDAVPAVFAAGEGMWAARCCPSPPAPGRSRTWPGSWSGTSGSSRSSTATPWCTSRTRASTATSTPPPSATTTAVSSSPAQRAEFFRAVGDAAWRRQGERGWVSNMPVRLWKLQPRD